MDQQGDLQNAQGEADFWENERFVALEMDDLNLF